MNVEYSFEAKVYVTDLEDADDDGLTETCGDCGPLDATVGEGAAERCDGLDNDCDGDVDEDFATDGDGDGVYDCLDPCPDDAEDDQDGDGACDSDDPCPEDPEDGCVDDDTNLPDDTSEPGEDDRDDSGDEDGDEESGSGGCSCAHSAPGPVGLLAPLALMTLLIGRRRLWS